jgi:hypothetical protein
MTKKPAPGVDSGAGLCVSIKRSVIYVRAKISRPEHNAEKHVLGLDPRMNPHPDRVRVQAFQTNIMLNLLESITLMRFDRLHQNAS